MTISLIQAYEKTILRFLNPRTPLEAARTDLIFSLSLLALGEAYRAAYSALIAQQMEMFWSYGQVFSVVMLLEPGLELIKDAISKGEEVEEGEVARNKFYVWLEDEAGGVWGTTML